MATIDRKDVYEAIDSEREYQDERWKDEYNDEDWSIGDWIIFMERYVNRAKDQIGNGIYALDEVRKVAALAVACMEYCGAPLREE